MGTIGPGVPLGDDPGLQGECMDEKLSVYDISIDKNARTIILQQGLIPFVDATLEFVAILLHKPGIHNVSEIGHFLFRFVIGTARSAAQFVSRLR